MAFSGVGSWIIQLSDRWFLAAYTDDKVVGAYSANYSLVEFMIKNPLSVALLFISLIIFRSMKDVTPKQSLARLDSMRSLIFAGIVVLTVFAATFSDELVVLLATREYSMRSITTILLSLAQAVQIIAMFEGIALQVVNHVILITAATAVGTLVNLLGNMIFIPQFGATGAAVATLLSYFSVAIGIVVSRVYVAPYSKQEKISCA